MTSRDPDSASRSSDPASAIDLSGVSSDASTRILADDPISDVLDTIRLQGAVFFVWEPSWPYGIGVADGRTLSRHILTSSDCIISYHIVTKGPCWAAVNDESPLLLESGDTLILPRGDAYKIANTPQYPTAEDQAASIDFFRSMTSNEAPAVISEGGPGPENNKLICGFLGCNMGPYNPLLSTLPRVMRVPAPTDSDDPLSTLIAIALSESQEVLGGERSLLMRLSEVMFVEILRRYFRAAPKSESSWLAALQDPLVGRALALLHKDIAVSWTLQKLADSAGASRSALADHFSRIVGVPPMQYLTQWRMQVAAHRLRHTQVKVQTVAHEVGYESDEAFSRAFKRVVGVSPREWRSRCGRSRAVG